MHKAYHQVFRNHGSAGIDGMRVTDLLPYVREHRGEVIVALKQGSYQVQPILGVNIPKSNGKEAPTKIDAGGRRLLPVPEIAEVLAHGDATDYGQLEPVPSAFYDDLDDPRVARQAA